jgi:hypothetical protein
MGALRLYVRVLEGKDVACPEGSDVVVSGYINDKEGKSSAPQHASDQPKWDAEFNWKVESVEHATLRLQVATRGGKSTILGDVAFAISSFPRGQGLEYWFDTPPKGGQLHVTIAIVPWDDTEAGHSQSPSRGAPSTSWPGSVWEDDECPYSDEELDRVIAKLMAPGVLPDQPLREWVLARLNHGRIEAIVQRDYETAEALSQALDQYLALLEAEGHSDVDEGVIRMLWERYCGLQDQANLINKKYDERQSRLRQDEHAKLEALAGRHAEARQEFEEGWRDPARLREYAKPSPELLAARQQEKAMAIAGQYHQARLAKAKADALEKKNTEMAQARANSRYRLELDKLLKEQRKEIQAVVQATNATSARDDRLREGELRPLQAAMALMRAKKPLAGTRSAYARLAHESAQGLTPRSRATLANFRSKRAAGLLSVCPPSETGSSEASREMRNSRRSGTSAPLLASGDADQGRTDPGTDAAVERQPPPSDDTTDAGPKRHDLLSPDMGVAVLANAVAREVSGE